MSEMDEALKELLDDLLPTLHSGEATSAATLQLLKEKGIVSDEELAPCLEQSANASSVKQRAARVRFERLFAVAIKGIQQLAEETAKRVVNEGHEQNQQSEKNQEKEASSKSVDKQEGAVVAEGRPKPTSSSEHPEKQRETEKPAVDASNAA